MTRLLDHYANIARILDQEKVEQNVANLKNVTAPRCECQRTKRDKAQKGSK